MKRIRSEKPLLPSSNPAEDLETISRNKFCLLFPPSLFEIRQEFQRDKGIDLTIELKQDNTYTNFRIAVQLKSTASSKVNKDQSVSFPVEVSNINYLLNYGMPAYYVLYDHRTGIFYLEESRIVFQTLLKQYHPDKFPKQFTVKFSKQIIQETIKQIYDAALESGLLLRRINAHLGSSAVKERSSGILIEDEKEVYSVEQNIEFIDRYGLLLLNRVEYKRIVEIEQRTHPRKTASPIFNLVCGVAYFQQSSLFKAIEFLKAAQSEAHVFEPPTRSMLTHTFLRAKHLLGMIEEADFKKAVADLLQTEGLGSYLELEKDYANYLENPEKGSFRILQNKISSLITDDPNNRSLRARGYAIILDIEQKQLLHNLALSFVMQCGRVPNLLLTNTYKKWKGVERLHSKRLQSLLEYCLNTHYFLGFCNVAISISEWSYQKLFILYILKNWDSKTFTVKGKKDSEELRILNYEVERIDQILNKYEELEHRENGIHTLTLKYEILDFADRKDDANVVAAQITSLIEKHDMNGLKPNYLSVLKGNSRYQTFLKPFTQHMNNIYHVAKNSGFGNYFQEPIPEEYLRHTEFSGKEIHWIDGDFFQMTFPT